MDYENKIKESIDTIKKMVGDKYNITTVKSTLGGAERLSFCIEFHGKNPAWGIKHNCPLLMHIWVHDVIRGELNNKVSFECANSRLFRKITAKTLAQALIKLEVYFAKNKQKFDEIYTTDRKGK